jgi:2-oxoglutarate dehydrogenase E2 component (dihydrolipoamide succinyltransferase)
MAPPPFRQVQPITSKKSVMRKRIAEHMVMSRRTSAHVHSVFEVNFSRVAKIAERRKPSSRRPAAS